jgi:hypothetical protein
MTHSNVRPLNGSDVFFDGCNESNIVQSTMWDNSETWFFGITIGGRRLDRDMIATVFVAHGIGNHICLARMVTDLDLMTTRTEIDFGKDFSTGKLIKENVDVG